MQSSTIGPQSRIAGYPQFFAGFGRVGAEFGCSLSMRLHAQAGEENP